MEQSQNHIWLTASSYMVKYLRISSYIRTPFLMTLQLIHSEFPYIWMVDEWGWLSSWQDGRILPGRMPSSWRATRYSPSLASIPPPDTHSGILEASHRNSYSSLLQQCYVYKLRCTLFVCTLLGKSHLCIPFLGIARPQSQFPHSCVCERFIHSQEWSTYFHAAE